MRFGTSLTNSNMLKSKMVSPLGTENTLLSKFSPKNWNCLFKMKLSLRHIQICWIRWWCSLFLFWTGNRLFGTNLIQKDKIVWLRLNLVPRLIHLCWIRWRCLFVPFWTENTLYGQIWCEKSKFFIFFLSWCGMFTKWNERKKS